MAALVVLFNLKDAQAVEAYEKWGEQTLMTDKTIGRYSTHIVWSRVKFSTAVAMGGQ